MATNARNFDPDAARRQLEATLRRGRQILDEADARGRERARESERGPRPGDDVERAVTPDVTER